MRDLIGYVLFRVFSLVCRALGARGSAGLGCLMGLAFGAIDSRRGRVLRQIALAVGPGRARSLVPKYYEHLGLLVIEYARLMTFLPERVDEWFEPEGLDRLNRILARGKGGLFITGHLGNWELTGQALTNHSVPLRALFKPLKNPHLDGYLREVRQSHGMNVHQKADGARFVMRTVRAGEASGLLVDQDGSSQGTFVPFFGRLASTLPTAARLARRTGAAIVPVTSYRLRSRTKHRFRIGPEIELARTGDEERDILLTTWRCNRALEEAILEHPAQWLWAHRRWRTRPGPEDVAAWERAVKECGE